MKMNENNFVQGALWSGVCLAEEPMFPKGRKPLLNDNFFSKTFDLKAFFSELLDRGGLVCQDLVRGHQGVSHHVDQVYHLHLLNCPFLLHQHDLFHRLLLNNRLFHCHLFGCTFTLYNLEQS